MSHEIPETLDLLREPGDWDGPPPDGQLRMTQVGPALYAGEPGWVTVAGWRQVGDEPTPRWVRVQVRKIPRGVAYRNLNGDQ